jgi:hypothetical protein
MTFFMTLLQFDNCEITNPSSRLLKRSSARSSDRGLHYSRQNYLGAE